ncbi:WD repeat-containing protein 97 isoform X1 [Pungitius pungitius]|uniref:WD repeat-containing protein 97 isoform X1 n=2 Tax=Pungitius pungitius TaxID=134920 RepID=UPI002E14A15B
MRPQQKGSVDAAGAPSKKVVTMVAPGEETSTTTVLLPGPPTTGLSSPENGTSDGETPRQRDLFKQDGDAATDQGGQRRAFTHGLRRLRHFPCGSPVRSMTYSDAAAAFVVLHSDDTACFYTADGLGRKASPARLPFAGLTATKVAGRLAAWGPGPVFTLLDGDLRPLHAAPDALDIRLCQAAEHCTELVTAGAGNVCVWSVMLARCMVKVRGKLLRRRTFTELALAPPRAGRPHAAFVACGADVTLVDLEAGKVSEHKRDLCSSNITAMVYCSPLDCLIAATQELSIRVWGPDWEPRVAFVGHNGVVSSLFYCPALSALLSASEDCTIRSWDVAEGRAAGRVHTERGSPALFICGTEKGDTFASFSPMGVELWAVAALYTLHCVLRRDERAPVRQILASPLPAPFPSRVLCVSGDGDITLVAAETGAVLTSLEAKQRVACAAYCLQKELLLALTDTGTVLRANALTNPITLTHQWKGSGQGPWQPTDHVAANKAKDAPTPGPACCLVLYGCVAETQKAFEEWRSLRDGRGPGYRNRAALDDAKNKSVIILGQSGGCVSVLDIDDGKVLCRTQAHSGHKVTAMQVYPEDDRLLSAGEDMTVVVWQVNLRFQDCLSQRLSVSCGHPPAYLAALGPQLALTSQEPTGTYNLMHFNSLKQSHAGGRPNEGHSDHFTGLCACSDLDVFVSSSLDGTVCVWNERNHLIRTLQLNAVPECLAYSGFGGELYLGIKGDLYRMDCAEFLPHYYQQMLLYTYYVRPPPDVPVIETKEESSKGKTAGTDKDEREQVSLTHDATRQKEYVSPVAPSMDLAALLRSSVKCQRGKPPSTKETKKEAFYCYMKILYRLPHNIKIDLEDMSDPDEFEIDSFHPEPYVMERNLPILDVRPESRLEVVKKMKKKKAPVTISEPNYQIKVEPRPVSVRKPVTKECKEPPARTSPTERPKPDTPPAPPPPPRRHETPAPPREPDPEMPKFLKQFADEGWFKELYPDKKSVPSSLSPEDFSLQLLGCLNNRSAPMEVLGALRALHSQGILHNADTIYRRLADMVPKFVGPHMSAVERAALVEILKLLARLESVSYEFVKMLLTLLAFKNLGLRETVLSMLTGLPVQEAERWLWPELESWDSEPRDQSDVWASLSDRAGTWLEFWISKYNEHNRDLHIRSTEKCKGSTFSVVEVLNHCCYVQKEEHRKARRDAPAGRKNIILLPPLDCSSLPILRLGETYSMARAWRPPGVTLPPRRNRPFLMNFPHFISLPLTRITVLPFHICSEEDWVKASLRRYFIQQQSHVEYYR